MERLTYEGDFCDIAMCFETRGGSFCEDGACPQRKVWARLKQYEDTGLSPEEVLTYKQTRRTLMAKFTVELPFYIGQAIWVRDIVNGEEVDTMATVSGYTIDEFGVEISINVPGKEYETSFTISSDYTPRVDPQQVANQWLFETKAEMDRYFKDKGW